MGVLYWIVGLALVAFELVAGIGKSIGTKMAVEGWLNKLDVARPFMSAFGGLEAGAAGVILSSLFFKDERMASMSTWACLALVVLKVIELALQIKAGEPFAAMVGPLVVIALTVAFYFLK